MQILRKPSEMREWASRARSQGRLGLVPTMGALHQGHQSLLKTANAQCDSVVMSLFVNPTQFAPGEDLARYPRDEAGDVAQAEECGVDVVFAPSAEDMYLPGFATKVVVEGLSQPLCGSTRPGHFDGVCGVVSKLFHICLPHVAFFGEKDFQQLAIVRHMVRDLDFGVEIVGCPIVRESDGVAMSSRNQYLSTDQRREARVLSRGLRAAESLLAEGIVNSARLVSAARAVVAASPLANIEYIECRDADSLAEVAEVRGPTLLAMAVRFGTTRLIDNTVLRPPM